MLHDAMSEVIEGIREGDPDIIENLQAPDGPLITISKNLRILDEGMSNDQEQEISRNIIAMSGLVSKAKILNLMEDLKEALESDTVSEDQALEMLDYIKEAIQDQREVLAVLSEEESKELYGGLEEVINEVIEYNSSIEDVQIQGLEHNII